MRKICDGCMLNLTWAVCVRCEIRPRCMTRHDDRTLVVGIRLAMVAEWPGAR